MNAGRAAGDRALLYGFGCLGVALCAGLALALVGFGLGLNAYFYAQRSELSDAAQAPAFLGTLEAAVAWCGVGSLGLLIATASIVVLFKELGEESARRARGEVR